MHANAAGVDLTSSLSTFRAVAISLGYFPASFGWAITESLIIPYLLELGCPFWAVSWAWLFSPILATQVGPKFQQWGDEWTTRNMCGWRGRKQFILFCSIFSAVTMFTLPRSHFITRYIFQSESTALSVFLVCFIFTVMDLSHIVLRRPVESLFMDVCMGNREAKMKCMRVHMIVQSFSKMLGYAVTGVWLEWDLFGQSVSHIVLIFTIGACLVLLSMIICLLVSPNPPETIADLGIFQYTHGISMLTSVEHDRDVSTRDEIKQLLALDDDDTEDDDTSVPIATVATAIDDTHEYQNIDGTQAGDESVIPPLNDNPQEDRSVWDNVAFHWLWWSHFIGSVTNFSVALFWTSFTALNIYDGYPTKVYNSYGFMEFESGLVYGVFGLLLMSLIALNCSILYSQFGSRLSSKHMYLIGQLAMATLCFVFFGVTNEIALLVLIALFGAASEIHLHASNSVLREQISLADNKSHTFFDAFRDVFAPVFVALLGGPIIYAFNKNVKWIFLLCAIMIVILNSVLTLIIARLIPNWKLFQPHFRQSPQPISND